MLLIQRFDVVHAKRVCQAVTKSEWSSRCGARARDSAQTKKMNLLREIHRFYSSQQTPSESKTHSGIEMPPEDDFPVPSSKRRRTSNDSSDYTSRSSSRGRDGPRERKDVSSSMRRVEEDSKRPYVRSRSRENSDDDPMDYRDNGDRNLAYRRRNRSRSSEFSHSSRSKSRSHTRGRRLSRSRSPHSQDSRISPSIEPQHADLRKQLSFKQLHILPRVHARGITSVKFSPDLLLLAIGSADASISIYSVTPSHEVTSSNPPLKHLRTLRAHLAGINALAWSPIGPLYTLASASDDKSILLWSPLSSDLPISPSPLVGHSNYVYSLAFSPKGNMLVSGSYDEAVFLWDVRSARIMRRLPAHADPVSGVDFLRDGSMVVSCAEDGLIRIWDSATGQCLKTLVDEDRKPVTAVRFTPNGKFVLAWTLDGCIRLWKYTEGACVKTYTGHMNKSYSLSGTIGEYMGGMEAFVASGSEDGDLVAWDVTSKEVLWRGRGHEDVVLSVDYGKMKDGRGLLVSAGKDRDVRLWVEDIEPRAVNGLGVQIKTGDKHDDEHDAMVVDVNIRRTPGGDVKIEETDAVMRDGEN